MQPEYPYEFDRRKWIAARTDYPIPCSMLRLEMACGNATTQLFVQRLRDGSHRTIAICELCQEEIRRSGAETTDFWRAKQREWGVR